MTTWILIDDNAPNAARLTNPDATDVKASILDWFPMANEVVRKMIDEFATALAEGSPDARDLAHGLGIQLHEDPKVLGHIEHRAQVRQAERRADQWREAWMQADARLARIAALADEWESELEKGLIREPNTRYAWSTALMEIREALYGGEGWTK